MKCECGVGLSLSGGIVANSLGRRMILALAPALSVSGCVGEETLDRWFKDRELPDCYGGDSGYWDCDSGRLWWDGDSGAFGQYGGESGLRSDGVESSAQFLRSSAYQVEAPGSSAETRVCSSVALCSVGRDPLAGGAEWLETQPPVMETVRHELGMSSAADSQSSRFLCGLYGGCNVEYLSACHR